MVAGFHRSFSLPGASPNSSPKRRAAPPEKSYHVRSTSLPCRSHPLISQLDDEVRATRAWQYSVPTESAESRSQSSAWLLSGLIRLELLHLALDDLLKLPQTRESLRRSLGRADRLLDDFLRFADAYGSFRSALVSLQQLQSAAQVSVRRRDGPKLASLGRSLRKTEKEIAGLASVLRDISRSAEPALSAASPSDGAGDAELAGILREMKAVTVSVSTAVFLGTVEVSSSATSAVASRSPSWTALRRRLTLTTSSSSKKKKCTEDEEWTRASERLESLEECLGGLESGGERVFRSFINTRVSLLNILTP